MNPWSAFSEETISVYVDEFSLKMAKIQNVSGKELISGVYYKNVSGLSETEMAQEILTGMKALKSRKKEVSLVLSSKYVITKNIEVPSTDEKEIKDIVRLQAGRHTPYSKEEIVVDYLNLEVILERYTKLLLVIVSNENAKRKTDLLQLAKLEINAVYLASESLAMGATQSSSFLHSTGEGTTALIYLDSNHTDLMILNKRRLFFIRNIPIGLNQLEESESENIKRLFEELKKTCDAYKNDESGEMPERFLMAGIEVPQAEFLCKLIEEEFKVSATIFRMKDEIAVSEEAKTQLSGYHQVSLLEVMLAALFNRELSVDLTPHDLKIRKAFRQKGQDIFIAGILVMVIFVLLVGTCLTKIYFRSSYLDNLHKNFEIKNKEAQELVVLSEQTRIIIDFKKRKGISLLILKELQTLLPNDIYLNEISLDAKGHLTIKGTSELMSRVFSLVTEFENSPYFKNVKTDYTKSRKVDNKDIADFGFSANLEGEF